MMTLGIFLFFFVVYGQKQVTRDSSKWGRLYLRRGVEPIQYFKANYGPTPLNSEKPLYFAQEVLGCSEYSPQEAKTIGQNHAIVVVNRGECAMALKTKHAQKAGASGLIIISTSDETVAPTAAADDEYDFQIVTVMIRQSGGLQLQQAAKIDNLFGRLTPIYCERPDGSLHCSAFTDHEKEYAQEQVSGGFVYSDNNVIGEFLMATYGPPLISTSVPIVDAMSISGCESLASQDEMNGAAVLLPRGDCHIHDKVKNAQEMGAAVVIIVSNDYAISRPMLDEKWKGYDVQCNAMMVSHIVGDRLKGIKGEKITFTPKAQVAAEWQQVYDLSQTEGWPSKKSRRENLLRELMTTHFDNKDRYEAIKLYFQQVAGGQLDTFLQIEKDLNLRSHDEL